MKSTSGNRIFTGSLAAFSRAHCRRFVAHLVGLRSSAPGRPACRARRPGSASSTKFDSSGTSVRRFRFWRASRRGRPSSISRSVRGELVGQRGVEVARTRRRARPRSPRRPRRRWRAGRGCRAGPGGWRPCAPRPCGRATPSGSWTPATGSRTSDEDAAAAADGAGEHAEPSAERRAPTRPPSTWRVMISSARNWPARPACTSWWWIRSR